jgi:hypothetical protein
MPSASLCTGLAFRNLVLVAHVHLLLKGDTVNEASLDQRVRDCFYSCLALAKRTLHPAHTVQSSYAPAFAGLLVFRHQAGDVRRSLEHGA